MRKFAVILAAAGKSSRFGDPNTKKVFTTIDTKPLWLFSAEKFSAREDVGQLLIVISPEDEEDFKQKYGANAAILGIQTVLGGAERADSVRNALEAVREDLEFVAIHDAARPCISEADIDAVFAKARQTGAALLGTRCSATLKRTNQENAVVETVPRDNVWLAQTPQVFHREKLLRAYAASENASRATDEASLLEAQGETVTVVEGSPLNIKVTTRADLKFVQLALKARPKPKAFPFE